MTKVQELHRLPREETRLAVGSPTRQRVVESLQEYALIKGLRVISQINDTELNDYENDGNDIIKMMMGKSWFVIIITLKRHIVNNIRTLLVNLLRGLARTRIYNIYM